MDDEVIIRVENLWKRYGLPLGSALRKLTRTLSFGSQRNRSDLDDGPWALRDVSFEVRRGETLGIIGRNGAGKSTLLKVLAGVTPPTKGHVEVRGRIFPMIELNAGLHMELTGRENVRLLGAVMGLTRREIEAKMPEIEDFCELGEWFDRPVRTYSSGMLARLGFGVAMNVEADILLVDEVLAVGDLAFQRKCYDQMERLRSEGIAILFVSHNIRQVERLCDRVLLLDSGTIIVEGSAPDVIHKYFDSCHEHIAYYLTNSSGIDPRAVVSTGEAYLTDVYLLDHEGKRTQRVKTLSDVTIRIEYEAKEYLECPVVAIGIRTIDMLEIIQFSTDNIQDRPDWKGSGVVECRIPELNLLPGTYLLRVYIRRRDGLKCYRAEKALEFQVVSDSYDITRESFGLIYLPVRWNLNPQEDP